MRQALMAGTAEASQLRHARTIARITRAIAGDSKDIANVLPGFPAKAARQQPVPARLRTRLRPWQCSTPSWPAAYNLACAYAAVAALAGAKPQPDPLIKKVVRSLEFAICNPECEMERPSEWIGNDPDLSRLCKGKNEPFTGFLDDQRKRDYPADSRIMSPGALRSDASIDCAANATT